MQLISPHFVSKSMANSLELACVCDEAFDLSVCVCVCGEGCAYFD